MGPRQNYRALNRNGKFNVTSECIHRYPMSDLYHRLLSARWHLFFLLVFVCYLAVNTLFGLAYFYCGPTALDGISNQDSWSRFQDCFFFSVQTLATIGYGKISPAALSTHLIVTLEALTGILSIALITGLLFARFARPTARVLFSNQALISPHEGVPSFVFRMANERMNQIVEAKVNVVLAKTARTKEGERFRKFYPMKLLRDTSPLFAISWTVIHPITEESPLFKANQDELLENQAEIFVTVSGMDDTYAQMIHSRFSYTLEDIVWNHRFLDILTRKDSGGVHVNLKNMHQTEPLPTLTF